MKKILLFLMFALFCIPWAANAQQTLPYSCGFESGESLDGWELFVSDSSYSGLFQDADLAHSGSLFIGFNYREGEDRYLVSPLFTGADNGLDVTFYYKSYSDYYYDEFQVGYTTDESVTDPASFIYGDVITEENAEWSEYINSFPAGTKRIAIKYLYNDGNGFYLFLDDFLFEAHPNCAKPATFTVSNITTYGAAFEWENTGAGNYQFEYKKATEEEWVTGMTHDVSYTLSNLTQNTAYNARVKAVCGTGDESGYKTLDFTTLVACPAPTNVEASDITSDGATIGWTSDADAFNIRYAPCFVEDFENGLDNWTIVDADGDGFNWESHINTGSGNHTAHSGNGVATTASYDNNSGTALTPDNWLISPQVQLGGSVSLWAIGQDASWADEHFAIFVSTTGTDPADFTMVSQEYVATGEYVNYTADLSSYSGMGYVAVRHFNVTDMFYLNIDDFIVYAPESAFTSINNVTDNSINLTNLNPNTQYLVQVQADCGTDGTSTWTESTFTTLPLCHAPADATVTYEIGISAMVNWSGDAESYNIDVNGEVTEGITDTFYLLNNLALATTYSVKVQAVCAADNVSAWANAGSFTTDLCMPEDMCEITFELTDSYGDGWNGNAIKVVDVLTGNVLGQFANTSEVDADEAQTYTLSVCDGREIQFVWVSGSFAYETSYTVYDRNGEVIFEGSDALSAPVNYVVDCTVPACPKPKDLAYAINADGATISWTGTSDSYNVQLGVNNATELFSEDFADGIPADWTNDETYAWTVVDGHIQSGNAGVSSSTSAISMEVTLPADGTIEFDAECNGEGTYTYYDHCDFYIDGNRMLYAGANISGWNHYKFDIPAGEHTVVWSYTKDSSVNPTGDYFAVDNVVVNQNNVSWYNVGNTANTQKDITIPQPGEIWVRVQGVCDGETGDWSAPLVIDFTPVNCEAGIVLNAENDYTWTANFEGLTNVTTPYTGAQPACWTVSHEYFKGSEIYANGVDTLPQVYYNASSGNHSLCMYYRALLAMPELDATVDMSRLRLSMDVLQTYTFYRLQVGVMTDPEDESTFVPVALVDNSGTTTESFECGFKNYSGTGRYIAFKNVGGSTVDPYSTNFLDNITLSYAPAQECGITSLPHNENFEGFTSSVGDMGIEPDCWEVITPDVALTTETKPQLSYSAATDNYSLRMMNRCVYAMPALNLEGEDAPEISDLSMTFDLLQPKAYYALQVGVVDASGDFEVVKEINNVTTTKETVTVNFSSYSGSGSRIAFRNVLRNSANYDYSYNYIDNIHLYESSAVSCPTTLPYTENFESYTVGVGDVGVEPDCWDVVGEEESSLTYSTKPQVYCAASGNHSLQMVNRCVYALPSLEIGEEVGSLTMTFDLLQPRTFYLLEVGVVDASGNFELVEEVNNSSTETSSVEISIPGNTVRGKRIAFHNILRNSANYDYSYNYIDNISITASASKSAEVTSDESAMESERYLDNIAVYPNPTTGLLHIDAIDVQKVECYSQMGQLVGVYDNVNELNISELANGVYMLRITVPQGVTMRKVVKR